MPDGPPQARSKGSTPAVDTGAALTVIATGDGCIVFNLAGRAHRAALIQPKYVCPDSIPLATGDALTVARRGFNNDFLATGPCGCLYLLYHVEVLSPLRVVRVGPHSEEPAHPA